MSLRNRLDEQVKKIQDQEMDEANVTGGGEAYDTPHAFGELDDEDIEVFGYKKAKKKKTDESVFVKAAKMMMLDEASYKEYKRDDSASSKQKVNKSIREINRKLYEIERILAQNIKLKTEDGVDKSKYWKSRSPRRCKEFQRS